MQANAYEAGEQPEGPERFRLRSPEVIEESVDGEALIVDLLTGSYYSCEGVADDVWRLALSGMSITRIGHVLVQRYDGPPTVIRASIRRFVEELQQEGLIVPLDVQDEEPVAGDLNPLPGLKPFEPPVLQKFSELQDLLLLDPIHDVAASGWPIPKPEPA